MKHLAMLSLLLGLLGTSVAAHSEGGCPPGWMPYSSTSMSSCGFIPGYNQKRAAPQPTPPQWADRWGAIATDASRGAVGEAKDFPSRQAAEQSVIADCRAKGGTDCKLQVSYVNGCGALVVGDTAFVADWGITQEDAAQKSLRVCSADTTNCHVYFTTCSPAVRFR
ncbi:DUF4189 domain-containing protein [Variovorax sp. J22P240]|uniref:DUF4189 domain-containing protein n=1 Tax=Variovorax sp. J22P240 TaxID=3053514 RepID=UPI002576EDCA|nr:DUF4189 domain-containing protein [Variovorax sp. J22P240]MDL9998459.1 DUF4189 domain-containing protein [Variovorax sp. J22P240]